MTRSSTTQLRAVIFDVDGTLAETERDGHRRAFNDAFREFALPYQWSVSEYGRLLRVTGGRRRLALYLGEHGYPDAEAQHLARDLHELKTQLFLRWVRGAMIQARPGVRGLMKDLQNENIAIAVATTGSRAWVNPLLDRLFGGVTFDCIVTGDDVTELKPAPEVYLKALSGLGLSARDAVAVEDSPPGLAAAVGAGLPCLVVTSAYTRGQHFPGAAAVVPGYLPIDHLHAPSPAYLRQGVTVPALVRLQAARATRPA